MADITQTTSSVKQVGSGGVNVVNSGEALTVGNTAYKATNGSWLAAVAGGNTQQAGTTNGIGVCLNSTAGPNQPVSIFQSGTINLGATLTVGETYVLSVNAGRIAPISDLITNSYVTILGVAADANNLATPPNGFFVTGAQRA